MKMKKVTKFFMVALLAGTFSFGYAQNKADYEKAPKSNEKVIGTITRTYSYYYADVNAGHWVFPSLNELYNKLLNDARNEYNSNVDLREIKWDDYDQQYDDGMRVYNKMTATVVAKLSQKELFKSALSQAMKKAFREVPDGARLAIDRISSDNDEIDRESLNDQVTDLLLDKGYRIVAKEYFAKLYEEQQAQQSGIYNERTTVQENNFSAVGYYINVKVTETSLRVQVVNVSTGDYEGNATVNF